MSGRTRGWCPTLFEPMVSGDGLLARIKPPLSRISTAAARELAATSRQWGNGQLELTNRGALQARGFTEASSPAFRAAVVAAGLASADAAVERRRNVVVSPFTDAAGEALARELENWIAEDDALAALPAKFGFAIETPDCDPRPLPGDIRLSANRGRENDAALWRISLADGVAGQIDAPLAAARDVAHQFLRLAAELDPPPRRMTDVVRSSSASPLQSCGGGSARSAETEGAFLAAGALGGAFALGLPFGALSAEALECAADLADRFADGVLRLSPWRALILAQAPESATSELAAAAGGAGFVVDSADQRLSVVACAGAPGCASAHATTRVDAGRLAARGPRGLVHLSGCAKGCAHPAPAPFTLVATPDGYALVCNGRAGDTPARRGLTLDTALDLIGAEPAEIP